MEPAAEFVEIPIVVLSEDDMELWERASEAFNRMKRIPITRLLMYVRVVEVRKLVTLGLIERRRTQVFKASVVATQARGSVVHECLPVADCVPIVGFVSREYDDPATISRTAWDSRVRCLPDEDRRLLWLCIDNINPKYHQALVARIMANKVYQHGYGPEDLTALMLSLNFDPRGANYALPKFLAEPAE